ncbi:hypothetical protein IV102_24820 [bacterium]|nr:hypothetical protein [bacterium]
MHYWCRTPAEGGAPLSDYLIGNVQGSEAQHYLQVLGARSGAKNDNVYFVLSVEGL